MDFSDLRVFEAVARLGGMKRAGDELNTVQSNVTARIRQLEDELGTPLFARHARGVTLTEAGRRLLPYAERARAFLAEARQAAIDDGTPCGRLVLGSLETTAAMRLSPHLAAFLGRYPDVDLNLKTGTTAEMIQAVLDRSVDGALVCGPVDHPELTQTPVFDEELVVLTAPHQSGPKAGLSSEPLRIIVLRAGCSYRQRLESVLAKNGKVAERCLEFGTLEAIFGAVSAGLGITLLPRGLVGPVVAAGRVAAHPLPHGDGHVQTVLVRRHDSPLGSALGAFIAQLTEAPAAPPRAITASDMWDRV